MNDPATVLNLFVRGIAAGGMAATALGVWRSGVNTQARLATLLLGVSTIAWLITESDMLFGAFGYLRILDALAFPAGAFLWLFILVVFEDWRITPLTLAPAAALLVTGLFAGHPGSRFFDVLWVGRNVGSGLLDLWACFVVVQGWRGDLVEGRRRLRAVLLGLVAVFGVSQVVIAFLFRLNPNGPWLPFAVGKLYGGSMLAVLILAGSMLFLQARPEVFGASRRSQAAADPRAEAADRLTLEALERFMAAEGWRREGLSIGDLAAELSIPEHRLRRLINRRLGHRNFAEFLNSHRIEAAKRRLADPAEARTTVAAVAFDLGYGSLGPFNRAFRAATGASPTEWRRQALQAASPKPKEAV